MAQYSDASWSLCQSRKKPFFRRVKKLNLLGLPSELTFRVAKILIRTVPDFTTMPDSMYAICYRQYLASALMLLGYSVELLFKGLSIQQFGIEAYTKKEKKYFSHRLVWLVGQHIQISSKEHAILECLTHFIYWAGRYPDHGSGEESKLENIFTLSEKNEISMKELTATLDKLVKFAANKIIESSN